MSVIVQAPQQIAVYSGGVKWGRTRWAQIQGFPPFSLPPCLWQS